MKKTSECFDLSSIREYNVEAGRADTITEEKLAVIKEMKAQDPDSPVSWYFLRELCKKGKITTLKYGNSWLINVDEFYAFFQGGGERK